MATCLPPFTKLHELNQDLEAPDEKASSTNSGTDEWPYLPGYPRIPLRHDSLGFLNKELLTPELDLLSPHLWLVATQRSDHVSALHHQLVRGRAITITEDPKLYLIWIDIRVYIKPIPSYLLSHAFWIHSFSSQYSPFTRNARDDLSRAALGFLRTYAYLIEYESDFRVAKDYSLIPSSTTWKAWNAFISQICDVPDTNVSARYRFGELRLNFLIKVLLGRMNYFQVTGQTSAYLARAFAPLFFVWAKCNVILAEMQVVMSVQALYGQESEGAWIAFAQTSRWFSVAILVVVVLAVLSFLVLDRRALCETACFRDERPDEETPRVQERQQESGSILKEVHDTNIDGFVRMHSRFAG